VKDFKVSKDALMIELVVGPVDYDSYVLRPYWDISLYLDEVYPGNVFGIKVFVCANTGEIISYSNMAHGGIDNPDGKSQSTSANDILIIATIACIAIAATASAVILVSKKKHK